MESRAASGNGRGSYGAGVDRLYLYRPDLTQLVTASFVSIDAEAVALRQPE
jgi:hypothetical protein